MCSTYSLLLTNLIHWIKPSAMSSRKVPTAKVQLQYLTHMLYITVKG